MNRPAIAALLAAFALSPAHAGPEALKAADLSTLWNAARQAPPSVEAITGAPVAPMTPEAPAFAADHGDSREFRRFNRGGFTFESEAATALREAENGFRQAGIALVASRVTRESAYPWKYGLEIEYYSERGPYGSSVEIETYRGGLQTFESDAREEMRRTINNLRAAGETVILGLVSKEEAYPWRYYYSVDFLRRSYRPGPGPGPRVEVYQSGIFNNLQNAKWDLDNTQRSLERRGYRVVEARIHEARGRGWYYVVRYVGGGHGGPGYPPGPGRGPGRRPRH